MTKLEIEHGEGRAELDRQHHDTTSQIGSRSLFSVWQNYAIIAFLIFIIFEESEHTRLNAENDRLTRKNLEQAEIERATAEVLKDSQAQLERATYIAELLISTAVELQGNKALKWATDQPGAAAWKLENQNSAGN